MPGTITYVMLLSISVLIESMILIANVLLMTKYALKLSMLIYALSSDCSKVSNSLDIEAVYPDEGGCVMSRHVLPVVDKVVQHFDDGMLSLH